jgi:hypothetical protein
VPSTLIRCCYNPGRGGHAPSHLRDALLEVIEDLPQWQPGMLEPIAAVQERAMPLSVLCGLLWNCPDILPGFEACELERVTGKRISTYASAARAIKAMLRRRLADGQAADLGRQSTTRAASIAEP